MLLMCFNDFISLYSSSSVCSSSVCDAIMAVNFSTSLHSFFGEHAVFLDGVEKLAAIIAMHIPYEHTKLSDYKLIKSLKHVRSFRLVRKVKVIHYY